MEQTYQNHRRFVPLYHFVTSAVLLVNLGWSIYRLIAGYPFAMPLFDRVLGVLVALALISIFLYTRVFALTVQNRVIRQEMRLRLAEVLPADLRPRIPELSVGQLVALRFASDEELAELARKVLDERIRSGDAIKRMVRRWQADHLRA
ncbi:MAG TPA: DUF6526 family protein [Thermoanaerobaculia bacterium]|nr:DUF6526 family protein [Thermoanaerobaculia bacterium]